MGEPEYYYVVTNVDTGTPWLIFRTEQGASDAIERWQGKVSSFTFRMDVVRMSQNA